MASLKPPPCHTKATHKRLACVFRAGGKHLLGRGLGGESAARGRQEARFGRPGRGKSLLQLILNCPNLATVKQKPTPEFEVLEGRCAGPQVCPLSHVKAGAVVCIRHL